MTYTTPFTAVTGAVITASGHNASVRDNILHLRSLLPDASGSGLTLVSTSATAAAFSTAATVPAGLIAAFETAAAIASGWARYSSADGRMLVGAGTTFAVTYTEATDYGASWNHSHTGPSHSHTYGHTHTASDTTAAEQGGTVYDEDETGNGHTVREGHTHTFSLTTASQSASTTSADGTGLTSLTAWVIPSRAIVWAQKS